MPLNRFALVFLGVPLFASAQNWSLPFFTSDPRAVLAAAARFPAPENIDAITIDYSVEVRIDNSGKIVQTTRKLTRVLRLQGIEGARRVAVPWLEWRQNRPKLKARVITGDGTPHFLDDSAVNDITPEAARQVKVLSAVLSDVDVDSVIELEIGESDREAVMPGIQLGEVAIDSPFLIGHFKATVDASSGSLKGEPLGFSAPHRVLVDGMRAAQRLIVETSNLSPARNLPLLPPQITQRPTVVFTNVPNWQTVAQWYASLVAKAVGTQTAATTLSSDARSHIENVYEILRTKLHDNGVPFGASPYTPRPAAETLKTGSGDSKDQAIALIRDLAGIGITAQLALISAGPDPDVMPEFPGLEAFNRALVYIPGERPLWIDPAAEFTPVFRLPIADEGRWALSIDPTTTHLLRTPESTAEDNLQSSTVEIHLQEGAGASVTQTVEARGIFEETLRPMAAALNSADKDQHESGQEDFTHISAMEHVAKVDACEARQLRVPCRVKISGDGYPASQIGEADGYIDLPGPLSPNMQRLGAKLAGAALAERSSPRAFNYYAPPPFIDESTFHVIPPAGYKFNEPPSASSFTAGPLQFSMTAKFASDGSLWVTSRAVNPKASYTPQEVEAPLKDNVKLSGQARIHVVFCNIAGSKLANGDFKEAIALLRQHAAAPAGAAAEMRLAAAYVDTGARAEAVKLCNQIIAKEPNDAAAHARLGWVWTHDEFGRQFSPGMDMAEAEKHYIKARELDPNTQYTLELAILYTFNPAGIRFGNSARLEQAIQTYRQISPEDLARTGALNDYLLTLLFAGRYEELRQFFLYPQAENADPAIKLAGIAASSSVDDLKEEAAYEFPDASKRAIVLIEAARYLVASRKFRAAASLFDLAGGAGHGISAADLAKIRRAADFDDSRLSQQPAVAAFQRFVDAVLNPTDAETWKKYVTPEIREIPLARLRWQLLALFSKEQDVHRSSNWPALAGVLLTTINFSAQAIGNTEFRIFAPSGKPVAIIAKGGNEYLLERLWVAPPESATTAPAQSGRDELARLRSQALSLAGEGKFKEAAALEQQICANSKATGIDWNELAWIDLFAHAGAKTMQEAADKAAEMIHGSNLDVLHTLAVVQASTERLKEARANAYNIMDLGADPAQILTIFGRIAEQLDLRAIAKDYYGRVPKPEHDTPVSTYAFAQMRLKGMSDAGQ